MNGTNWTRAKNAFAKAMHALKLVALWMVLAFAYITRKIASPLAKTALSAEAWAIKRIERAYDERGLR